MNHIQTAMYAPDMLRMCPHCGKRPGTHDFAQDVTAFAHGWSEKWCEICVLEVQIEYARQAAGRLSDLESRLRLLRQQEADAGWTERQLAIREQAREEIPKLREQAEQGIAVLRNKIPSNNT